MAITIIIQTLIAMLPLLLKWLHLNAKGSLNPVREARLNRILGLCGKCRAAGMQAGYVPDDNTSADPLPDDGA